MIQAMIVEDEVLNAKYLREMLEKHFPEIEVIRTVDNIPEAIEVVKDLDPDLLFLDVNLDPYTGFNLLEETREMKYHTIFTTHYSKHATKAFKFAAVHFLEKPFGLDDLKEAVSFYKDRTGYTAHLTDIKIDELGKKAEDILLHNVKESLENQIIGFPVLGGIEFYAVKDIIWCQADSNYTTIGMTGGRKGTVTKTLKKVELLLQEHNFYRVHNSALIHISHMRQYLKGDGGVVVMNDDKQLDVARSKKEGFLTHLRAQGII